MKHIVFATSNYMKFLTAQHAFKGSSWELVQKIMDIPEIQHEDVGKIATFSAEWACKELGEPVVVTDAGYDIKSLHGFPGPFVKYINEWLTPADYLGLLEGIEDRTVVVKECLAFASPGKPTFTLCGEAKGMLAKAVVKEGRTSISSLFIPEGYSKTEPEIGEEEMVQFWTDHINIWQQFAQHLESQAK